MKTDLADITTATTVANVTNYVARVTVMRVTWYRRLWRWFR